MQRYLKLICVFVMSMVLASTMAYAAITGAISGTVTDSTGAVIAGVTVEAVNEQTGVRHKVVTNSKGSYTFSVLDVGSYTISASMNGFDTYQLTGIKVDANSELREDLALKVGSVAQTEVVRSNSVVIETQSTQLGEVITGEKMTSVPLNGRSFTDLLQLQPGVSPYKGTAETAGSNVSGDLNPGNQSVNGGREASNGFMVNGGDVNDGLQNGAAIIPNLDSISEFRIITNNFDAEYGNFSGGQVNVVTKSGTNQIHGSVFEFFRNTNLDAANYFAAGQRGEFKQNIYGGTFGAPIHKDKLFFFVDFQGTNQTVGNTINEVVPSDADRTGNLLDQSASLTNGVVGDSWAQTLSNRLGYTVVQGEPYYSPGCSSNDSTSGCVFPGAVIPTSAWSSAATKMLPYVPPANSGGTNFVTSAYSGTLKDYKGAVRVDNNTRYGTLFGYYFIDNDVVNNPWGGSNSPGFSSSSTTRAQLSNVGLTTIFKNNSVNTFRFTYMRVAQNLDTPTAATSPSLSSLGFVTPWGADSGGIDSISAALVGVPQVNFNNFNFGNPVDTQGKYNNTFQWLNNYMRVIGTHTLQVGVSYHYDQINERNYYAPNGQFTFDGQETGLDFADYLLGAPSQFIQASRQVLDSRSHYVGAFAQDSWRALPTLTFNYGLRYEVTTPWYDTQNKIQTIIPGEQSQVFPGAPVGYVFPGDPGVPRTLAPIRWNNFAPRLGFAYAPNTADGFLGKITGGPGQFSLRGGYGIFYTNIQDATGFVEVGDAPFGLFYVSPLPSYLETPYIDRADGTSEGQRFPFNPPPGNVSTSNPDTSFNWASVLPISGAPVFYAKNAVPYVQSFYLGFERQLGGNTLLAVNYVGNVGRKLLTNKEANPGDAALCLKLSDPAVLAPGQTPCGPGLQGNVYNLADGSVVEGTRPILGINFGSNPYMITAASSSYNSLQTTLKHTSKNYDVLFAYTFSRSFDDASGLNEYTNSIDPRLSRALSLFDVTHNFAASYTVQLPFDRLVNNRVTRGWAVSGITTFASGLPVNISENDDRSLTAASSDLPNYDPTVGPLITDRNPRHGNPYFNVNAFSQEVLGQFGNSKRRFFHGPGLNNTDLALLRDFHIHESHVIQLRVEAFNIFNHAQFQSPNGNFTDGPGAFGIVTAANDPRIMQLAIKYHF